MDASAREQLLRTAHQRHPNDLAILMTLGEVFQEDKAAVLVRAGWYRAALAVHPGNPAAWNNLGAALGTAGDVAGAAAAYREAVRLDPKNPAAHSNLGVIYLDQKKYPEAIAAAREAIRLAPKFSNAHAMLGDLLQRIGDIRGARAALTEAARLDPRWKPMLAKLPPVDVAPPPREVRR